MYQQRRSSDNSKPVPNYMNFVFGGTAGMMASCIVHPLDLLKNRMQVSNGKKVSLSNIIQEMVEMEGAKGFYKGLTASLFRQATYTTTRLGVYNNFLEILANPDGTPLSFFMKAGIGMVAGATGAFIGNPAELCLIRMTADGRLPVNERRNYTHVGNALYRIMNEEGILTLWRGCVPTVVRACCTNATQLATYTHAKQRLLVHGFREGISQHLMASMLSGFATSVTSLPIDIIKTRVQNMKMVDGVPEYNGSIDALNKLIARDGVASLWKGFVPYYARVGPHTVLTFIFLEQLQNLYKSL